MDEAKVDVVCLMGFKDLLLSADGYQKAAERIQNMAALKNYKNALVMDKDDEFEQKQIGLGDMGNVLSEIRKGIAADTRIPMTKLFGMSAAGFNAGDDDIENYNAKIETEIRSKDRAVVLTVLKIRCQQLFGYVPENISFEFKPLRILSHNDAEDMKGKQLQRILDQKREGLLTAEKAAEMLNALDVNPIKIDANEVADEPLEKEPAEGAGADNREGFVAQRPEGKDSRNS
jgi:phage-related protein (TIGR01555 family)